MNEEIKIIQDLTQQWLVIEKMSDPDSWDREKEWRPCEAQDKCEDIKDIINFQI